MLLSVATYSSGGAAVTLNSGFVSALLIMLDYARLRLVVTLHYFTGAR